MKKQRFVAALLCLAMVLALAACGGSSGGGITCVGCMVNGEASLKADGKTHVAKAILPEGLAVDHWEINGVPADAGSRVYSIEFTADFKGIIKPVLRPEKAVKTINAHMQILDNNGVPGEMQFTNFVFEYDYANPTSGKNVKGGVVSFKVTADVPAGMAVDYWLINGAAYVFENRENSFTVVGLTEARTYEVVLKAAGAAGTFDGGFSPPDGPPPVDPPIVPPIAPPGPDPDPTGDIPIIPPGQDPDPTGDEPIVPPTDTPVTPPPATDPPVTPPPAVDPPYVPPVDPPADPPVDVPPGTVPRNPEHQHNYHQIRSSSAWCTEPGMGYYQCECGEFYEVEIAPPLDHNMQPVYDATGTLTGFRCSRCGAESVG